MIPIKLQVRSIVVDFEVFSFIICGPLTFDPLQVKVEGMLSY